MATPGPDRPWTDARAVDAVVSVLTPADRRLTVVEIARRSGLSTLTLIPVLDEMRRAARVSRTLAPAGPGRQQAWTYALLPDRRRSHQSARGVPAPRSSS